MHAETIRKKYKNKYKTISYNDLVEMINKDGDRAKNVLYFKIIYDEEHCVSVHESIERFPSKI